MKPDLSVSICEKKFKNPLILASGILGDTVSSLKSALDYGLGGVTSKSTSWVPRKGNPKPWLVIDKNKVFVMNAVGLANVGVKKEIEKLRKLRELMVKQKPVIIASIFGPTIEDIAKIAKEISKAEPDFIEVNISCPHADPSLRGSFYSDPNALRKLTEAVKKTTLAPIIIKLSPNVADIASIAKAAEEGGADVISAINTVGPGMVLDLKTGKPILSNKVGGVSGPAIKPITVRCIYQIAQVVKIPIIGMGGITTGEDAVEVIMAGAHALGIGSAFYLKGPKVFNDILQGIESFMKENKYQNLADFRCKALQY